ncbi:MAG: hypothetical protein U9R54_06215, partial [Bacteroidota bacterium]|nr:hypothetical protein [Bacteroidota bacterium]
MKKENSDLQEDFLSSDAKIWKFEVKNHYMQVIMQGNCFKELKTEKLSTDSISSLLEHSKRNEFLNLFKLDWVHENFIYPELIIDENNFQDILNKEINTPLDLVNSFLKNENLHSFITTKLFYEKVCCNKQINTSEKLSTVCKIIFKASNINIVLNDIEVYINKLLYDKEY